MSNFDSKFAWPGTNRKFAITNSTCYLNDLKKSVLTISSQEDKIVV